LPSQGQLFRYNAGTRGTLILPGDLPATITDAGMNVIYAATGSAGNGVGNFNFIIQEGANISPAGTVTVNVSPPGVPNVLYLAKSTNSVEIQFDRTMADPSVDILKKDQFTVKVNGAVAIINTATLKQGDPYTILLTLGSSLAGDETILISYFPGNIVSTSGGLLLPFTDEPVILTSQTIDFAQDLARKYSDSPFAIIASASSGLGLTYSSSNLPVATIIGNIATFHSLGSTEITARQAGNATYAPVKYSKTLTVAIGDQVITFNALPVKTFGDADFNPGATSSSGLPVSYTSSNTSVATIVGGWIHILAAGSSVITASRDADSYYNAALSVNQMLTVNDPSSKTLNLTSVLLQGLYDAGGKMRRSYNDLGPIFADPLLSDTITVELHNTLYSSIAYKSTNVKLSTSGAAIVSVPAAFSGSYYITVKHRNHIETTSAAPVSFGGNTINYAFDLPSRVFGENLILINPGGYYAIYGGDVNQNGLVESFDMTPIDNLSSTFGYGFNVDVNSDGSIDSRDMTIVDNNNSGFVSSILP
jgi:hypothetical protein